MARTVKAIPRGYHTVTPHLVVRNCSDAIDFYRKAFGAEEKARTLGPDGKIMHAEIVLGDSIVTLADENPQMGTRAPTRETPAPITLTVYTDDAKRMWKRATGQDNKVLLELGDQFWGDRYGTVVDPYGYQWAIAQHIKDMTKDELAAAQERFFASQRP